VCPIKYEICNNYLELQTSRQESFSRVYNSIVKLPRQHIDHFIQARLQNKMHAQHDTFLKQT
jgi:hypothetical protein